MANIHGIDSAPLNRGNNDGAFQGQQGEIPNFLRSWTRASQEYPEPRKETFFGMLKMYFAPNLTWRSFVTLITLVQLATFIICFFGSII